VGALTLDAASNVAFARLREAGNDPTRLREEFRTVVVVYGAQGVIDNGGLQYFFESDWPGQPPYALFSEAYRRIGADLAAECIDRATAMFPFPEPHLAARRRLAFLESLAEDHELFALGDAICGNATVWLKLEEYVRDNEPIFGDGGRTSA
jgi:hypothetical protein